MGRKLYHVEATINIPVELKVWAESAEEAVEMAQDAIADGVIDNFNGGEDIEVDLSYLFTEEDGNVPENQMIVKGEIPSHSAEYEVYTPDED